MRGSPLLSVSVLTMAALVGACSTATAPGWTFPPPAAASAAPATSAAPAPSSTAAAGAVAGAIEVTSFDLGFNPKATTVDAPGRYAVTLKNTGAAPHDLTFADGTTTGTVNGGASATVEVDVPAAGLAFLCSIPGHAAAGMEGSIAVKGTTAGGDSHGGPAPDTGTVLPDPAAPKYTLHDATAPKVRRARRTTSTWSSRRSS
jgi:nitrite reductase (NO-forming)